jgi:hypothetical protein
VGSGKWEVGSRKWEVGSGKWEVGSGKWEVGSGKWEVGKINCISALVYFVFLKVPLLPLLTVVNFVREMG